MISHYTNGDSDARVYVCVYLCVLWSGGRARGKRAQGKTKRGLQTEGQRDLSSVNQSEINRAASELHVLISSEQGTLPKQSITAGFRIQCSLHVSCSLVHRHMWH